MAGEIQLQFSESSKKSIEEINVSLKEVLNIADQLNKTKLEFGKGTSKASKNLKDLTDDEKALLEVQKARDKVANDLIKQEAKLVVAQSEQGKQLVQLRQETNAVNQETKSSLSAYGQFSQEVKNAKEEAKNLGAELRALANDGKENTQEYQELSERFDKATQNAAELDAEIKELDSSVGDNQRNVGNYKSALDGALGSINIMGVNLGQLSRTMQEQVEQGKSLIQAITAQASAETARASATAASTTATNASSKSLGVLRLALIATGIGAIVVLVGALVAAFLSTQRGADALTRTLEPLKAIFSALLGVAQDLGTKLVDTFKNPKQAIADLGNLLKENIINRFTAVGEVIRGLLNFDLKQVGNGLAQGLIGVEDLSDKISSATEKTANFLQEQIDKGKQIAESKIEIEKLETKIASATAKNRLEIDKLREISKDTSLTYEERAAASEQIIVLAKEQQELEQQLIKEKIKQLELEQSLNDTRRKGAGSEEELNKLNAELLQAEVKAQQVINSEIRVTAGLKKEQAAAAKAIRDAENERIASIQEINRTTIEQLNFEFNQKIKILKLDREISKLTLEEIEARTKLEEELAEKIQEEKNKELFVILDQVKALESKTKAYSDNIEQLETLLASGQASEENQIAINKELEFYKQGLADANSELDALGVTYKEIFDIQKMIADAVQEVATNANDAEEELRKAFESGEISGKQFLEGLADINESLQRDLIQASLDASNEILANEKLAGQELIDLKKKIFDETQKLRDLDLQESIEKAKEREEEIAEIEAGFAQAKQEAIQLAFDTAQDIAALVLENKNQELQNDFNQFAEAERKKQDYNAELLENGAITQEEYNARKLRSDNELARKEEEVKLKQFKNEKKLAIIQATISTAQAVLQALGSAPPPASFALAAIAGIAGAVQIGIIAAQKPPQFAKGKKASDPYFGIAEVGEQGPELVNYADGSSHLFSKPTYTYLPKGTEVLTATQTKKEMKSLDISEMVKEQRGLKNAFNKKKFNVTIINDIPNNSNVNYINGRV